MNTKQNDISEIVAKDCGEVLACSPNLYIEKSKRLDGGERYFIQTPSCAYALVRYGGTKEYIKLKIA